MRAIRLAAIAVAVLCFALILNSSILQVPTGTWQSTSNISSARANAVAILLPDGRIVFAGGTGADGQPTATAEAMSSNGTSSALPSMSMARSGHAATYTMTGDLLVTGGRTSGGGIVNSAEVFDSLSNTWSSLPTQMVDTRTGHTMSQLPDGNVLIAGGENSSGPIAALEIYDIGTRSFRFAGTLTTARKAHAAAVLNDGRVLIVGGTTLLPGGNSATLSSTEIYDPVTGSVSAGPNLATPRAGATATTLLDGRVLVTGGSYPEAAQQPPELAYAEIYDPATGSFAASASRLSTARTGHQAFLLPNNNNVLIAGGSSAGADLASAELYCPWNDTFQPTTSMSAARAAAAGSALGRAVGDGGDIGVGGMLVVDGGHNLNSADIYGFAWVKTDHTNYAPGSVVTITGSGWQPGETVTLSFLKSPRLDNPPALTAVADANGNIFNNQFSPGEHDLNVRVYLTAAGTQSGVQAQNTFTTSIKLYEATIAPTSDTAGHQSAPYTLTITNDPTSTNQLGSATITVPSGYLNVVLGRITQPPAGNMWVAALSGNQIMLAAIGSSKMPPGQSVSLALTATAPCTAGPYQWSTTVANFTLVGAQPLVTVTGSCSVGTTTTVASSANPSTYGQGVTFTATVSPNSGSTAPTGTVQFKIDGVAFGSPVTLSASGSNGIASSGSTSTLPVSGSPHTITADYTPSGNFTGSSGSLQQTVSPAPLTITANSTGKTYGQTVTFAGTEFTSSGLVNGDTVTSVTLTSTGAAATAAVGPYPIVPSAATGTGLTNYTITYANGTLTVNAAPLIITANSTSKTYGQTLTFTGTEFTSSGLVNGDTVISVTLTSDGAPSGAAPGSYPIVPSAAVGTGLGNYTITYVNGTLTVYPASSSLQVAANMYNLGFGSATQTCFDGTMDTKNNCVLKWLGGNIKVINGATSYLDCSTLYPASECLLYASSVEYFSFLYWLRDGTPGGRYEDALLHFVQDTGFRSAQRIIGVDHFDYFERPNALKEGSSYYAPYGAANGAFLSNGTTLTDVTASLYGVLISKVAYSGGVFTITAFNNLRAGNTVLIEDLTSATFLNGRTVTVASTTYSQFTVNLSCSSSCTGASENGIAALTQQIPNGDTLYLGYMEPSDLMKFRISTPRGGGSVTYRYSQGSGMWADLTTATNWSDGTSGLASGMSATQISFYPPADWAPDVVKTSKLKFWVAISVSGATTAPSIYDVRGDNLISTYLNTSQCGTVTNCFARGWNEAAYEASTACGGSACVVAGGYKYNPNPPANASARFRYQARATGYAGYPNVVWLNPSSLDTSGKTLAGSFLPYIWSATKAAYGAGANGAMFDNGASNIGAMYPTWQPNKTDLACAPSCTEGNGNSTFDNYWATVLSETTSNLHAQYGSQFYVTTNAASNWQSTVPLIAGSVDQSWMEYVMNTTSPGPSGFTNPTGDAQHSYDIGLAGNKVAIAQTDSFLYSYCDTGYSPCQFHIWNRGARGSMVALAAHYLFGNANDLLVYSITGEAYYGMSDQFWYFADATTLTAPITAGMYPSYSFQVASTTNLVATTNATCRPPGCGGIDNPYAGNIIARICPASGNCEDGDIFLVTTTPPSTVTISPQQGNSGSRLSGQYPYVGIGNSYTGSERVQVMKYGHQAWTLPANMPPWQSVYAYASAFPGMRVDIGVPDTVSGWQPPGGNCGYSTCNKGDRDYFYGTGCTTLYCSAQQWSALACVNGKYNSPRGGGIRDCSPLARRDYTNAIVLLRTARTGGTLPSAPEEWETPSRTIDLSSFESRCAPYCTYYRLRPDGTTDSGTSSVNLRGAEGAVMMKTPVTH